MTPNRNNNAFILNLLSKYYALKLQTSHSRWLSHLEHMQ
jgi:hypothetical protein